MVRKLYISGDAWNPDSQEAGTHTGGNGNAGEVKNYEECPYSRELGTRGISICCFFHEPHALSRYTHGRYTQRLAEAAEG